MFCQVGGSFIASQSVLSKPCGSSIGPTRQVSAMTTRTTSETTAARLRMKRRRASLQGLRPRVATGASASRLATASRLVLMRMDQTLNCKRPPRNRLWRAAGGAP